MLFHTWTFVLFFCIVYPVYLATRDTGFKLPWLLAASYVFYGWWNPLYLLLIVGSTTVDYLAVRAMAGEVRLTVAEPSGLARTGWPDFVLAFHDGDAIGPWMLARIARRTGLRPEDL